MPGEQGPGGGPPGGEPGWWCRFRALPRAARIVTGLALVTLLAVAAGCSSPPESAPPAAAHSPTPDEVSPTPELTLEQWREMHGQSFATVISTANGLVSAIDDASATQIMTSCDALHNNYRDFLQPVPDPPDPPVVHVLDTAKDAIFEAQRTCSGGVLRRPNLATARSSAEEGATLLHQVAGPAT